MSPITEAPIIEAAGLTKAYGTTQALAGLDLVAEPGQVLAVLGPNGAGKTTFIRSVATLVRPDGGTLRVAGHDVFKEPEYVRSMVGLAGQYAAVEPTMTGRENLRMVARLFGQSRSQALASTDSVLEQMGLTDAADRLVRTYSGGMRRKLDLGASLVGVPRLLLLDEPTTGLDPRARIDLWEAIRRLVEQGTDVLLTTQYLDEADHLASRIVIIDHGKAVAAGTPSELKQRAGRSVVEVHVRDAADLPGVAAAMATLSNGEPAIDEATRRVSVSVAAGTDQLIADLPKLYAVGGALEDIAVRHPKLDEVFLALTGQTLDNPAANGNGKGRSGGGRGGRGGRRKARRAEHAA
ncbi:MAG TPA: ATP-binding cassette domain-containing protein [Actinomycetota bacterium]|nr:ATP-binding cassette domain-containing protein [Actinomycetota bacterium]